MNTSQPQTFPAAAAYAKKESRDTLVAAILTAGLAATAAIGSPFQFVLPETIKSVVAALFVVTALAVFVWRLGQPGAVIRWSFSLLVPFVLAVAAVVSAAWSPLANAITEAVQWALMGVIAFLAVNVLGRDGFPLVARRAHLGALIVSCVALAQFWFDFSWFPASAGPGGNFGNRNFLAEFIATTLPFSFWLLLRETDTRRMVILGLGQGVIALALLSTGTRSALVAAIACIVLTGIFIFACRLRGGLSDMKWRTTLVGLAIPLALVLTLGWIPSNNSQIIKENFDGTRGLTPIHRSALRLESLFKDSTYVENSSFGVRRGAWNAGRKMIAEHPVRGVGAGAWNTTVPLYLPETIDNELVWLAHNEPLQLVTEYGLVGWIALLALAWLMASALTIAAKRLKARAEIDEAFRIWTAASSIAMFGIVSLSGLPLHMATTCYILALSMGCLIGMRPHHHLVISPDKAGGLLAAGRVASLAMLALGGIVSIQGIRSDMHIQTAAGMIHALGENKSDNKPVPKDLVAKFQREAINELHRGLDIYSEHGYVTIALANSIASLEDPTSVLWLNNLMLETRPHVVGLKCNIVRSHSDLGNFAAAGEVLEDIRKNRPNAICRPLSEFIYAFKQGKFSDALPVGQRMIHELNDKTEPEIARYVVDMSYRAAIRVPAIDAAVDILRVRAGRWPELRASSWLLMGLLLASQAPTGQVSADALDAFKRSLAEAASPQEKASITSRMPETYRLKLN